MTDNYVLLCREVKLSLEDAGLQAFLRDKVRKNLTTVQKVYEFLVKQGLTRESGSWC